MQKIFIVLEDRTPEATDGNFQRVNDFLGNSGFVVSVTAQQVAGDNGNRGRWLIVADDGKGEHRSL